MFHRPRLLVHFALLALAASICQAEDPARIVIEEVAPIAGEEARFPATMRAIGVKDGNVSLVVAVDEKGSVSDLFVVEATRRAFAQSALKAVGSWRFNPATYNGQPFPSTIRIDMDFKPDRTLRWHTLKGPVETNIAQRDQHERPVTAVSLEQLDSIPLPISLVEPERWEQGQATIEFYIDELGNVRCPKLVSGTNLDFGRATLQAVSQWRFQPPIAQGELTNTLVLQTFHLVDGKLTTSRPPPSTAQISAPPAPR